LNKNWVIGIVFVVIMALSVKFYYGHVEVGEFPDETVLAQNEKKEEKKNGKQEEQKEELPKQPVESKPIENTVNTGNDLSICNENGRIMVVLYHKFADSQTDDWTRSFANFKKDLELLYKNDYYPVNMSEYIDGKMDVPYGKTPVVLTFDDGTASQLSFERVDGELIPKEKTAVAIYKKFHEEHPDFPMKGTFYLTGNSFFGSTGKMSERLEYLVSLGFEIGNQTMNHMPLQNVESADKVIEEVGGLAKLIDSYLPGYKITSFSIPGGSMTKDFANYVYEGTYDGFHYENKGVVLLFGSTPARSPIDSELNLKRIPRIRAAGKSKLDKDFNYWVEYFKEHPEEKYVSDGDMSTFVINESDEELVAEGDYTIMVKGA